MSTPYLGEIRMFAGNFAPRGWAMCNGQLLSISSNSALFAILGVTYGGNGTTTFALPNFMGRVPVHLGSLAGGSTYVEGQFSGSESVTLLQTQMPMHTHVAIGGQQVTSAEGGQASPIGNIPAAIPVGDGTDYNAFAPPSAQNGSFGGSSVTLSVAGGSQAHSNMQPYLVVNFIIATVGVFPTRN